MRAYTPALLVALLCGCRSEPLPNVEPQRAAAKSVDASVPEPESESPLDAAGQPPATDETTNGTSQTGQALPLPTLLGEGLLNPVADLKSRDAGTALGDSGRLTDITGLTPNLDEPPMLDSGSPAPTSSDASQLPPTSPPTVELDAGHLPWIDAGDASSPRDSSAPLDGATSEPDAHSGLDSGPDVTQPPYDSGQPPLTDCEAECQAAGGACENEQCIFDCTVPGSCADAIECPKERACDIHCGADACQGAITCASGEDCNIECDGADSCVEGADCNSADQCTIVCSGRSSCAGTLTARGVNSVVECSGTNACGTRTDCFAGTCNVQCSGDGSCDNGTQIEGDNVLLSCTGANSCDGDIVCNAGVCNIQCGRDSSCPSVQCNTSNANGDCP